MADAAGGDAGQDASGHRARLRGRLLRQGPDALLDHEVVEYLLALAIPRRDTKPLARSLLREFGGIGELFSADGEALARAGLSEVAAAAIRIADVAARRKLQAEVAARPILSGWQALIDYLHVDMAHRATECVRILHLNTRNMLIRDELAAEGSIDQAALMCARWCAARSSWARPRSSSSTIIRAGEPTPSRADIALTRDIVAGCKPLGIAVHDHVVIGAGGHASFRALGLL